MAGTLEITDRLCWMPAGWVYDNALRGMAEHVSDELRERLLRSLTDVNGGYLDLQAASPAEIHAVRLALQVYIDKVEEAGPAATHNPEFFDGYLRQLQQLEAMLGFRLSEASA